MRTPLPAALEFLLHRRSTAMLTSPAPTADQVALLLRAAATVPDHGELRPYRFVVVEPEGRERFGDALAAAGKEARPDLAPPMMEKLKRKAFAAPMQIVVIASPRLGMKIDEWEQRATAACTGYAITLAADALGLGAIWKSSPFGDGTELRALFSMKPEETILGWIHLGQAGNPREARPAIDPASLASVLGGSGMRPFEG